MSRVVLICGVKIARLTSVSRTCDGAYVILRTDGNGCVFEYTDEPHAVDRKKCQLRRWICRDRQDRQNLLIVLLYVIVKFTGSRCVETGDEAPAWETF